MQPHDTRRLRGDGRYYTYDPDHPLADSDGWVRVSRATAWKAWKGQPRWCHWCSRGPLLWISSDLSTRLCVDHLDGDRANDRASNLLPSCTACNLFRSKPGSLYKLCERAQEMVDTAPDPALLYLAVLALDRSRTLLAKAHVAA